MVRSRDWQAKMRFSISMTSINSFYNVINSNWISGQISKFFKRFGSNFPKFWIWVLVKLSRKLKVLIWSLDGEADVTERVHDNCPVATLTTNASNIRRHYTKNEQSKGSDHRKYNITSCIFQCMSHLFISCYFHHFHLLEQFVLCHPKLITYAYKIRMSASYYMSAIHSCILIYFYLYMLHFYINT